MTFGAGIRAIPFLIFFGLTLLQGRLGPGSIFWIYAFKTLAGVAMIWVMRKSVVEMRWSWSWPAVLVGILIFVVWVGLDPFYPKLGAAGPVWNPNVRYGEGSGLAWFFIGARILGSSLIVPPLEEVFYRSLVYRYAVDPDFERVPLGIFRWGPFLITAVIFGFSHSQWLAGILCGAAFQGLVCWKKRLGDAMLAHAITNLLLGCWVVWKGAWNFW